MRTTKLVQLANRLDYMGHLAYADTMDQELKLQILQELSEHADCFYIFNKKGWHNGALNKYKRIGRAPDDIDLTRHISGAWCIAVPIGNRRNAKYIVIDVDNRDADTLKRLGTQGFRIFPTKTAGHYHAYHKLSKPLPYIQAHRLVQQFAGEHHYKPYLKYGRGFEIASLPFYDSVPFLVQAAKKDKTSRVQKRLDYLRREGIDDEILEFVKQFDDKYIVWIAFAVRKDRNLLKAKDAIEHIIDWAQAENANLFQYSFGEANQQQRVWHQQFVEDMDETVQFVRPDKVVQKFDNGYTVVEVHPKNLKAEGTIMGHCVEGYEDSVECGECIIYSIRDPNNKPHCTIEIQYEDENRSGEPHVEQIQGKQDSIPVYRYRAFADQFLTREGLEAASGDEYSSAITGRMNKDELRNMYLESRYGTYTNTKGLFLLIAQENPDWDREELLAALPSCLDQQLKADLESSTLDTVANFAHIKRQLREDLQEPFIQIVKQILNGQEQKPGSGSFDKGKYWRQTSRNFHRQYVRLLESVSRFRAQPDHANVRNELIYALRDILPQSPLAISAVEEILGPKSAVEAKGILKLLEDIPSDYIKEKQQGKIRDDASYIETAPTSLPPGHTFTSEDDEDDAWDSEDTEEEEEEEEEDAWDSEDDSYSAEEWKERERETWS